MLKLGSGITESVFFSMQEQNITYRHNTPLSNPPHLLLDLQGRSHHATGCGYLPEVFRISALHKITTTLQGLLRNCSQCAVVLKVEIKITNILFSY
jgi:hypothetical protein